MGVHRKRVVVPVGQGGPADLVVVEAGHVPGLGHLSDDPALTVVRHGDRADAVGVDDGQDPAVPVDLIGLRRFGVVDPDQRTRPVVLEPGPPTVRRRDLGDPATAPVQPQRSAAVVHDAAETPPGRPLERGRADERTGHLDEPAVDEGPRLIGVAGPATPPQTVGTVADSLHSDVEILASGEPAIAVDQYIEFERVGAEVLE